MCGNSKYNIYVKCKKKEFISFIRILEFLGERLELWVSVYFGGYLLLERAVHLGTFMYVLIVNCLFMIYVT